MAPEQIKYDPETYLTNIGLKIDVWAVGIILYELCRGRRPFDHPLEKKLEEMIMEQDFPPIPEGIISKGLN